MNPVDPAILKELSSKLTDQGLIIAAMVILINAGLAAFLGKYVYKLLHKRDSALTDLSSTISSLNSKVTNLAAVQDINQQVTMRNRDLLQEQGTAISRLEICLTNVKLLANNAINDLKEHAKQCLEQHYKNYGGKGKT